MFLLINYLLNPPVEFYDEILGIFEFPPVFPTKTEFLFNLSNSFLSFVLLMESPTTPADPSDFFEFFRRDPASTEDL